VLVAVALIAGMGLRVARLDRVPLGFDQDEACNGYDAYSILNTGRDHHGNFLPLALQGFDDYRMPLFDYSLVPLVGVLGLKPAVVRLNAALWGSLDLVTITTIAGLMLGWPGAAVAAVLAAVSPWHLVLSRYGIETTAASATVSLGLACFLAWLRFSSERWVLLSGAFLGLSLYAYPITKVFTPLMIVLLTLLYWREIRQAAAKAFMGLGIFLLFAVPQAAQIWLHPAQMQQRFGDLSIFNKSGSLAARFAAFAANFASYFTPSYLFFTGDRGSHWALLHPPGFGELLPEQAPLIALALIALLSERHRKAAMLLVGWLVAAALPAALTLPLGILQLEPQEIPTPWIQMLNRAAPQRITPQLLLWHPDSRHDVLAMAPWILLSALGFVFLLEAIPRAAAWKALLGVLLLGGTIFHGVSFLRSYTGSYPILAAPYFQYGIEQALQATEKLDDQKPVIITDRINQPYIYVLFFRRYPPQRIQQEWHADRLRPNHLSPTVSFDHYLFMDPARLYPRLAHGIFVFSGVEALPAPAQVSILYPHGTVAYNIVVK